MRIRIIAAAVMAAALLALPSGASAAEFNVAAGDTAGITTAINTAAANGESDVINLAEGVYNNVDDGTFPQFGTDPNGHSITIIGAGAGKTVLNGASTANSVVKLRLPTTTSSLSAFTLNAATGPFVWAFELSRGSIQDFEINRTPGVGGTNTANTSLDLASDTRATDGVINSNGQGNAIRSSGDGVSIRRVELVGDGNASSWGLSFAGSSADVFLSRLKVRGFQTGLMVQGGVVEIEDSLIEMASGAGNAFVAYDQSSGIPSSIQLNAYRNTVVTGVSGNGVYIGAPESNDFVDAEFKDNLVYSPGGSVFLCYQLPRVTFVASGTAYYADVLTNACPNINDSVELTGSPFVDLPGRDFMPKLGSQVVDAGIGTASATGGFDLAGADRVTDGNGDGTAIVDIGAYEYQPPVVPPVGGGGGGGATPITTPADPVATAKIAAKPKKSFKIGKKGFAVAKKGAPSFGVTFADAASVKFTLQSIGKKKKLKSVKGSQLLKVSNGTVKFGFAGNWNKRTLAAGKYRVKITPLSSAGVAGNPVTVDIKLVK